MQFSFPIFEGLCLSWERVLHLGRRMEVPKGTQILGMGAEPAAGIYYVQEGQVDTVLATMEGPEKVLYAVGSGALFGEACCFSTGFTGEASVWTRTPCVLYFFRRETVEGVIAREHPALIFEMVGLLGYIVRMYAIWMRDSLTQDYFQRVCRILVYYVEWKGVHADPATGEVVIHADLTQNDLARLLGIHRISVAKAVHRLKETGILLRFTKRVLHIADFPRLLDASGAG